jgi:hypothetical protein
MILHPQPPCRCDFLLTGLTLHSQQAEEEDVAVEEEEEELDEEDIDGVDLGADEPAAAVAAAEPEAGAQAGTVRVLAKNCFDSGFWLGICKCRSC